ncbi:MAG: transposase, partial [Elusimicrobia bacterium]|nr:transposase [Elusimicrobiota bacterium]
MQKLLPVPYFMVTFTVPAVLRAVAWHHQRLFYSAMFEAGAKVLRNLGCEEKFLGGETGFIGVLHTHSRRLDFHPHLHFVVPAGAFESKTRFWKRKNDKYLFPWAKLAHEFDKILMSRLKEAGIDLPLVPGKWVVNCRS